MSIWLSYKELHLPNDNIRIINAPGNQKYIKEMINGEAFSDAAVLVVDATPENFERGIAEGGQTREHAIISFAFNKKQIIVAINKMDDETVRYSEDRYNYIKNEMTKLLTNIGYEQKCFRFIPISGLKGDNLITKSLNMTWWKGPSLLEMIDSFEKPERRIKTPLRFVVHKTIKIKNNETRAIGRVEYGFIKKDQMIAVAPSGIITKVDLIHKDRYSVGHAIAGDWVKLKLNISINDIKAGYVIGDQEIDPLNNCSILTAHLIVIDNPKQQFKAGYSSVFDFHGLHVTCEIVEIVQRVGRWHGKSIADKPEYISKNDAAIVIVRTEIPVAIDDYNYPKLSQFSVRDGEHIIAIGVVQSIQS